MQIHPVFHKNLLPASENNQLPGQKLKPRPPIGYCLTIDGKKEAFVNSILHSRPNRCWKNLL